MSGNITKENSDNVELNIVKSLYKTVMLVLENLEKINFEKSLYKHENNARLRYFIENQF